MTTEAGAGDQIDAVEVWRAISRLEGDVAALLEGLRETNRRLEETNRRLEETNRRLDVGLLELGRRIDDTNRRLDEAMRETHRRIDRLFYAILGFGGALLVGILASRFVGG